MLNPWLSESHTMQGKRNNIFIRSIKIEWTNTLEIKYTLLTIHLRNSEYFTRKKQFQVLKVDMNMISNNRKLQLNNHIVKKECRVSEFNILDFSAQSPCRSLPFPLRSHFDLWKASFILYSPVFVAWKKPFANSHLDRILCNLPPYDVWRKPCLHSLAPAINPPSALFFLPSFCSSVHFYHVLPVLRIARAPGQRKSFDPALPLPRRRNPPRARCRETSDIPSGEPRPPPRVNIVATL